EWQAADTSTSLLLRILFGDAQHYGMSYGIAIGNGLGKTFTALQYMRTHENVLYVAGNEFYNRKSFLTAMLGAANAQATGTAPEMLKQLVGIIESREETLIIVDDAHKLKNRVLHLLVLLANMQAEKTGMIIMGDDLMKTRIVEGVRLKQPGFDEIYKTIGRRFITLNYLAPGDIMSVCNANGLYDPQSISFIQETCGHNLHRATSLIAEQLQQGLAA
ncbi:MAG: ATP-binding protein, partial [Taibaiella sp.]|nr:ATP-binding protein [Taibaiella sp.]